MTWAFFAAFDVTGEHGVWISAQGGLVCGRMARHDEGPGVESRPAVIRVIQMYSVVPPDAGLQPHMHPA